MMNYTTIMPLELEQAGERVGRRIGQQQPRPASSLRARHTLTDGLITPLYLPGQGIHRFVVV